MIYGAPFLSSPGGKHNSLIAGPGSIHLQQAQGRFRGTRTLADGVASVLQPHLSLPIRDAVLAPLGSLGVEGASHGFWRLKNCPSIEAIYASYYDDL